MKLSFLGLMALVLLAVTSCQKSEEMTDEQLIEAIQKSTSLQNIDPADLPATTQSVLNADYSECYTEEASLAAGLGYEVKIRRGMGAWIGEPGVAYFDMNGKELSGDGEGKMHKKRHRKMHNRKECFTLVLPVSFLMPDNSTITIEEKEDWQLIKDWYEENPGYEERPELQFPVDVEFKDGVILTVNNEEEMLEVLKGCKGHYHQEPCFDFVYPITFVMPDGTEISGDSKEEIQLAIKAWYEENAGVGEKPSLQFPVDIVYEDGAVLTVENHEELKQAYQDCD